MAGKKDSQTAKMGLDDVLENLERENMSFVWKRRLTVTAFCLRMFLAGVEYAIILPSVWLYLKTFHVQTWFLGIVVAMYMVAAMISLPAIGRLFDKTKRTREILLLMNAFEVIGCLIYALPFSPYLLLVGRFIAGLGDGFFAAANGEIAYSFPTSKRVGIFALLEASRFLGLIIGPSFNFFLEHVDFRIARWHVFYGPAPGLFMVLVWLLMEVVTFFMVFNLSKCEVGEAVKHCREMHLDSNRQPAEDPQEYDPKKTRINDLTSDPSVDLAVKGQPISRSNSTRDDRDPILTTNEKMLSTRSTSEDSHREPSLCEAIMALLSLEILAVFNADLVLWLAQTEFEVMAPLVTQEDLKWKEGYLSIVYMVGGCEIIVIFFLIWFLGSKFNMNDAILLLFSLGLTTVSWLMLIVYQAKRPDHNAMIIIFFSDCFLIFISAPINCVASKTLLTKITNPETQGFTQGVYSSVSRIALILGPVLASSAFHNLALFAVIMALANLVSFVWLLLCLKRINLRLEAAKTKGR